jgi:hypothetical protein
MRSNLKIVLLLAGLVVGALLGYATRPESAEIRLGPVSIQVTGPGPARNGGPLTSDQVQYIVFWALAGAIVGFGIGYLAESRGFKL